MKIQLNKKIIIIGAIILFVVVLLVAWLINRSAVNKEAESENISTEQSTTSAKAGGTLPVSSTTQTKEGSDNITENISETTNSDAGNAMPEDFTDEPTEGEMLLRGQLPIMTQYFYMEYKQDTGRYLVTLYIDPNNADAGTVDEQLAYTKGQAEAWIADFDVDPAKLPIDYTDAR